MRAGLEMSKCVLRVVWCMDDKQDRDLLVWSERGSARHSGDIEVTV